MQLSFSSLTSLLILCCICATFQSGSAQIIDSSKVYKKKVLENTEIDLLMSLYKQDGIHSPVNGGIGTENLADQTATIIVSIPLNADDVLTVDAGISAYTSASSSNINPFMVNSSAPLKSLSWSKINGIITSGASKGGGGGGVVVNPGYPVPPATPGIPTGTPWLASTGASHSENLKNLSTNYSHSSDDRNLIWGSNISISDEFTYKSFGFGGNLTKLYNDKNTEIGVKGLVFLDKWRSIYPTELKEKLLYGSGFQTSGYFSGVNILDQTGTIITSNSYNPTGFVPWTSNGRDSYSLSFFGSQILNKRFQVALFFDLVLQQGMLSTPYHRIYFSDKPRYYIGIASDIPNYTSPTNLGVYQLADAIETLPHSRFKIPMGVRMNYYLNETFVLRSYYRYYYDNWGLRAYTVNLDLPVKLSQSFTLTPSYRFYSQNQVDYFGPYETHVSTEKYFTSDYDLSKFYTQQYSLALGYADVFTQFRIGSLGLKSINLKYSHFDRSDGLNADIMTLGVKFVDGEKK